MAFKNASSQAGTASYNQWAQLNLTQIQALSGQEGSDADAFNLAENKARFAVLTYQINSVPVNLSGDINVDGTITGYDHANEAQVDSSHNLYVIDNALFKEQTYSRIIQSDISGNTYIAHAEIGSLSGDSAWRVQKIDSNGNRLWADNGNFTQAANIALSGLTFAY